VGVWGVLVLVSVTDHLTVLNFGIKVAVCWVVGGVYGVCVVVGAGIVGVY
jgi:hypothetical protein